MPGGSLRNIAFKWKTHLTVAVVIVSAHQIDSVTILVPESALVGQSTVSDGRVVVLVEGGEGPSIVIDHGVTCAGKQREWRQSFHLAWILHVQMIQCGGAILSFRA